jgi:hypothetical protein
MARVQMGRRAQTVVSDEPFCFYPAYTALRARFYSQFRDFREAHDLLAEASAAAGNSPARGYG